MKVILSGGGTGGHIYPALTIADQIKKLQPEAEVSFVGTRRDWRRISFPATAHKLQFIEVAGFKRSLSLDTLRSAAKLFAAYMMPTRLSATKAGSGNRYRRLCLRTDCFHGSVKGNSLLHSGAERDARCNQ